MDLTVSRLRQLLNYNPKTGTFTWRAKGWGGMYEAGGQAGSIQSDGHRRIKIDDVPYPAGRLAFLWMTGRWPRPYIDHKNRNPSDDRWCNLREATHAQNQRNKINYNPNGVKGVTYEAKRRKYKAAIQVNGKSINLGRFNTAEEAHAAYRAAAEKYFGNFARASGAYRKRQHGG